MTLIPFNSEILSHVSLFLKFNILCIWQTIEQTILNSPFSGRVDLFVYPQVYWWLPVPSFSADRSSLPLWQWEGYTLMLSTPRTIKYLLDGNREREKKQNLSLSQYPAEIESQIRRRKCALKAADQHQIWGMESKYLHLSKIVLLLITVPQVRIKISFFLCMQ